MQKTHTPAARRALFILSAALFIAAVICLAQKPIRTHEERIPYAPYHADMHVDSMTELHLTACKDIYEMQSVSETKSGTQKLVCHAFALCEEVGGEPVVVLFRKTISDQSLDTSAGFFRDVRAFLAPLEDGAEVVVRGTVARPDVKSLFPADLTSGADPEASIQAARDAVAALVRDNTVVAGSLRSPALARTVVDGKNPAPTIGLILLLAAIGLFIYTIRRGRGAQSMPKPAPQRAFESVRTPEPQSQTADRPHVDLVSLGLLQSMETINGEEAQTAALAFPRLLFWSDILDCAAVLIEAPGKVSSLETMDPSQAGARDWSPILSSPAPVRPALDGIPEQPALLIAGHSQILQSEYRLFFYDRTRHVTLQSFGAAGTDALNDFIGGLILAAHGQPGAQPSRSLQVGIRTLHRLAAQQTGTPAQAIRQALSAAQFTRPDPGPASPDRFDHGASYRAALCTQVLGTDAVTRAQLFSLGCVTGPDFDGSSDAVYIDFITGKPWYVVTQRNGTVADFTLYGAKEIDFALARQLASSAGKVDYADLNAQNWREKCPLDKLHARLKQALLADADQLPAADREAQRERIERFFAEL